MITDEKRAFKRVRCRFTVKYKPHGLNKSGGGSSVSENISCGGFYFTSLKEFKIGELIDCCICMPETLVEGKWTARVVRCEKTKIKVFAFTFYFCNAT